jgi:hypothetical protein
MKPLDHICAVDLSNRRRRRAAVQTVIKLLEKVMLEEKAIADWASPTQSVKEYKKYNMAEESVFYIVNAIGLLSDAY